MNYAWIENGVVTNLIWLYPANAAEFPHAVPLGGVPAAIGDTWDGAQFLRDGQPVLTASQQAAADAQDMRAALSLLGVEHVADTEIAEGGGQ